MAGRSLIRDTAAATVAILAMLATGCSAPNFGPPYSGSTTSVECERVTEVDEVVCPLIEDMVTDTSEITTNTPWQVGEFYGDGTVHGPEFVGPYWLVSAATLQEHGLTCVGDPVFRLSSSIMIYYATAEGFDALHKFDGTPCELISAVVLNFKGSGEDELTPGVVEVALIVETGENKPVPDCRSTSYVASCENYFYYDEYVSVKMARTGNSVEVDAAEIRAFYDAFIEGYGFVDKLE